MSGSNAEVQELADQILALLGVRMRSGQLTIHYNDFYVQRCETNQVHRPQPAPVTTAATDKGR